MSSESNTSEHKEMFGFRADKPLAEDIHRFSDENNMTKSDALKTLVREGLEAEELRGRIEELESEIGGLNDRLEELEKQNDGVFRWFK
jgi:predicted nuclease with TOPRIM domain